MTDFLDEHGYPTEEALSLISKWPIKTNQCVIELFNFIEALWAHPDYFNYSARYENGEKITIISTAGWSGNEEIIAALKENILFWTFCWVSSRRGGHYEFKINPFKI